jgi:hypothetical protein
MLFGIEAHALIADVQMNPASNDLKADKGAGCAAVFFHVPKTFLHDPKNAKRDIWTDLPRNVVMGKFNVDALLGGELFAKCSYARRKPQSLQRGSMQAMRERVKVFAKYC